MAQTGKGEGTLALRPGFEPIRTMTKYLNWLKQHFEPLDLATPDDTLKQLVENSVRYWNTHSGYQIAGVYNFTTGQKRVQLDPAFKTVVNVEPTTTTTWIWNDHPLWTLMGITVLDNVTQDLIMMSEAFRSYKIYVGTNFTWRFEKSDDPTIGGWLYAINTPGTTQSLYVEGTRRITLTEDIQTDYINDWVLQHSLAQLKQVEGNTLRKSSIIDVKNDGQEMVNEGKDEQVALKKKLAVDGRWVCLARRV
jgi:hypothetical protein